MFLVPRFVPKTLQELKGERRDEAELAKQEAQLKAQFLAIRDYLRHTAPTGKPHSLLPVEEPYLEPGQDVQELQQDEQGDEEDDEERSVTDEEPLEEELESDGEDSLSKSFASGLIYCSPVTKTLLTKDTLKIPAERVIPLEPNLRHSIDGVFVTPIDANHCPGAVMLLFEVPRQQSSPAGKQQQAFTRILHTGDMRWQPWIAEHPALKGHPLDILYMDTTYAAGPKHNHPPQEECIRRMVETVQQEYAKESKTLFVIGAYHIGKERAFFGTAKALGWRIWCDPAKVKVMRMLQLPEEDLALLTTDKAAAKIHVTFMGAALQPEKLLERMQAAKCERIVGFRPTGWTYKASGKLDIRKEGPVTIYGIPYSEHSSFSELRDCVARLRPKRLIPTVNVTEDPQTARVIVDRFADLMDLSRDRSRLDSYFGASARNPPRPLLAAIKAEPLQPHAEQPLPSSGQVASCVPGSAAEPAAVAAVSATSPNSREDQQCSAACSCEAYPAGCQQSEQQQQPQHNVLPYQTAAAAQAGSAVGVVADGGGTNACMSAEPCSVSGLYHPDAVQQYEADAVQQSADATPLGHDRICRSISAPAAAAKNSVRLMQAAPGMGGGSSNATADAAPSPQPTCTPPAVSACVPADGDCFALDDVNLAEQQAILEMIQARTSSRSAVGGSNGAFKQHLQTSTPGAPSPLEHEHACSPAGKQKRQRTLKGFLFPARTY